MSMSKQFLLENSEHPNSLYTQEYIDLFGCAHRIQVNYQEKSFCQTCGLFLSDDSMRVFKTFKMKYQAVFNPLRVLQFTLKLSNQINLSKNTEYLLIRPKASERLKLSLNSTFLAVHFLDQYISQNQLSDNQIYLYAATALMLSAKSIELDERIPFISKLKRYASMTCHPEVNSFRTEEFKSAEYNLISCMQWKLQQMTLIDRVESFLSFGVIFDDDCLESENQTKKISDISVTQTFALVKEIESSYSDVCLAILKDKIFTEYDEVNLSLAIIAYLRKTVKIKNIWSQQLQKLTQMQAHDLCGIVSSIINVISRQPKTLKNFMMNDFEIQKNTPLNNYNHSNPVVQKLPFENPKVIQTQHSSNQNQVIQKQRTNTKNLTYLNYNENYLSYIQGFQVEKKYANKLAKYLNDSHFLPTKMKMFQNH